MTKIVVFVDDSETVHLSLEGALNDFIEKRVIKNISYINPIEFLNDVKRGFVYDLAILDINMPQMSGFELVGKLKQIANVKSKPAIALTTENSPEMKTEGKKVGLVGWLTKPFSDEKLQMSIKRVLRIR